MVIQINDRVRIKGTSSKGNVVAIRREFTRSGTKIPIFEIKITEGSKKGKIVQAKRQQLRLGNF